MVSTRGHRENDDSKTNLPQRECRKPRATMQEPEDEIIWESDENTDTYHRRKTRSGVTFDDEKSLNYYSEDQTPRGKSNADSKHQVSKAEIEKRKNYAETDAEGDTDSDVELFHPRHLRGGRKNRNLHHSINKELAMNGDDEMTDKSDHEFGLRRSSRHKKSTLSWIFVNPNLKGYPNMIHSSEPENDDLRPSRKPSRYIRSGEKTGVPSAPRRSLRSRKKSPDQRSLGRNQNYLLRQQQNNRHLIPRSRRLRRRPLRYRESQSEEEEDDEEEETNEIERAEEQGDYDNDDGNDQGEEVEIKIEDKGIGKRSIKKREESSLANMTIARRNMRTQRKMEIVHEDSRDETENSEEDDNVYRRSVARRRARVNRGRQIKKIRAFDQTDASSESESEEKELEGMDDRGKENEEVSTNDKSIDKPKRERKPVSRLTYEPTRRCRQAKFLSSDESKDDEGDDGDDDEEEAAEESKEKAKENRQRGRYSLRQKRSTLTKDPYVSLDVNSSHRHRKMHTRSPKMDKLFSSPARKQKVFNKKYRATHNTATSSSTSSSDEKEFEKRYSKSMTKARNRCLPMNLAPEDMANAAIKERSRAGSSLADIDPMHVDTSLSFDCVGGLSHHINALKEMIIFPLMYQEVFQKFSIAPPRGVLFYGPPGTGKTLVARVLAAECSHKDRKVAFFMRKGADCLSKWVGESERQLRLLFDQAYQMRPSIIFFDEIDGLAPVRSSRQDQIHSSIVSTLLALMDGLDSRGEVVVIGATNRVDAIDPALRRPGRFDREFNFPLPSIKARKQIINIHTRTWNPKPSSRLVHYLSEQTVGYCGADLKALCAEATLVALRTKYPQIYLSKQKLLLDVSKINIKFYHFRRALTKIVPAGQRATSSPGRKLNKVIQPLLQPLLTLALRNLKQSFPYGFNKFISNTKRVHRPRLLISGFKGQGQTTHLAPAVLHAMEKVPTHKLDLPSLFSVSARAPEEACAQVFHEARRNLPSIIYIPQMDQWWGTISDTVRATFLSLLNDFDPATPLFLLATSETPYNRMDEEIQKQFSSYRDELLIMTNAKEDDRRVFFRPLFFTKMVQKPKSFQRKKRVLESLPLAPPPQPRKLSDQELQKIEVVEEATLRELRIFLRQICAKLAKNRMFYIFTKPVDIEEVQDYLEVINKPMDLETMMTKIDHHQYQCAEDFLKDIDLICSNALEYNPDRNPEDKVIRHRACTLRDTAYAYIKAEMDTDFEMKCRDIRKARIYRQQSASELAPDFIKLAADALNGKNWKNNSGLTTTNSTPLNQAASNTDLSFDKSKSPGDLSRKRKRRKSNWARGFLNTNKKRRTNIEKEESKEENLKGEEEDAESCEAEAKNDKEIVFSELLFDEDNEVSLDSSFMRCEDDVETNEDISTDASRNKIIEFPALCNGNLSTEDSRDSMKVTSAADLLYNKSLKESIQKEKLIDSVESKHVSAVASLIEAEESVVSSSEPGCSNGRNNEDVVIDWAHLEMVYESCIAVTEGAVLDELHYLYNILVGLLQKHTLSFDRTPLLNAVDMELKKFAKFREKK